MSAFSLLKMENTFFNESVMNVAGLEREKAHAEQNAHPPTVFGFLAIPSRVIENEHS